MGEETGCPGRSGYRAMQMTDERLGWEAILAGIRDQMSEKNRPSFDQLNYEEKIRLFFEARFSLLRAKITAKNRARFDKLTYEKKMRRLARVMQRRIA